MPETVAVAAHGLVKSYGRRRGIEHVTCWTQLFSGGGAGFIPGAVAQAVASGVALAAAYAILGRRDPAA